MRLYRGIALRVGVIHSLFGVFLIVPVGVLADTAKHWLDEYRHASPGLYNDEGYRNRQYRAPTPESHSDATLVNTQEMQMMLVSDNPPKLINVSPLKTYENGYVIEKRYTHIATSVWLPNVGRGKIPQELERWFFDRLEAISCDNKAAELVFYCRADCWMSWNTIKRVARAGYTGLYWYREGLDGWRENSLPEGAAMPESYFSQQRVHKPCG